MRPRAWLPAVIVYVVRRIAAFSTVAMPRATVTSRWGASSALPFLQGHERTAAIIAVRASGAGGRGVPWATANPMGSATAASARPGQAGNIRIILARRLRKGNAPALPEEGDWPEVGETSEAAWRQAREHLEAAHARLLETLARRTDVDLDRPGGSISDRALGTGVTHRTMVVGLLQHAAYHSGQIVLLRKALGG